MESTLPDYDWVTPEMFDEELEDVVQHETAASLLRISGIYEALSEHFNNRVLENLERKRETQEDSC